MSDQDSRLEGDPIEVIRRKPTEVEIKSQWIADVFERFHNKCSNCGAEYSLHAQMIVPPEAGGKYVVENGVLICRVCEMASSAALHAKTKGKERRPINVWISRMNNYVISILHTKRSIPVYSGINTFPQPFIRLVLIHK